MRKILVSAFTNISSVSNNRILSIYNHLEGDKTVVTTDFSHGMKQYFDDKDMGHPHQIHLHVPAYKKNLSLARIWSHIVFARRVKDYLLSLDMKPAAVYCTMPTSYTAYKCARFCKKHKIKFIIDVIDLWPDSLLPLLKGGAIIKLLLYPWYYLSRYAYKHADVIMGESVAYANQAKKYNDHARVFPIYLGVDVQYINMVKAESHVKLQKPKDEIWIGYAGSLGNSYDFGALLDAIKYIHGRYDYKLWIIGDGVRREEIERSIKEKKLNAEITGFLPYQQLLGYLSYCDIAVNIFQKNSRVVYSYKFNDYVAMNCFVLNSLEGEAAKLVDDYQIGRNFDFTDHPLSQILDETLAHWADYSIWRNNTKRLIDEKLDKDKIYYVVNDIFNL